MKIGSCLLPSASATCPAAYLSQEGDAAKKKKEKKVNFHQQEPAAAWHSELRVAVSSREELGFGSNPGLTRWEGKPPSFSAPFKTSKGLLQPGSCKSAVGISAAKSRGFATQRSGRSTQQEAGFWGAASPSDALVLLSCCSRKSGCNCWFL